MRARSTARAPDPGAVGTTSFDVIARLSRNVGNSKVILQC